MLSGSYFHGLQKMWSTPKETYFRNRVYKGCLESWCDTWEVRSQVLKNKVKYMRANFFHDLVLLLAKNYL